MCAQVIKAYDLICVIDKLITIKDNHTEPYDSETTLTYNLTPLRSQQHTY